MDWYSFGLLLYENITLYLIILAASLVLYFFIFRTSYLSFLDPFIFNLLYSVFGFSVVIFLYATDNLQTRYLFSYLITQAAFFAGLFIFKPLSDKKLLTVNKVKIPFADEWLLLKIFFFTSSSVYIIVQLVSYKLVGIPLFMASRTGAYADTGGLGLLGRFIEVLRPATIFMLIYFLFKKGNSFLLKLYLYVFTAFLLLFFALSGSKSLFMTFGFILFVYLILNANELKNKFLRIREYERYLIIFGFVFAFFTIFVQQQNEAAGDESSITVFLYRLVASGDTYYFSYPNNRIETINGSQGFLALFGDVFSVLRIIPRENQPGVLGVQLYQLYYNNDLIAGPNARQNVFGYVYYGFYGSILFSFIIGAILGFVRNKLIFIMRTNVMGQIIYMFLYLHITFVETDPPVAVSGIENTALILPVFIVGAMLIYVPFYHFKIKLRNQFCNTLNVRSYECNKR